MAIIISADKIKKDIPGYDPLRSELVHEQSARLADLEYQKALKQSSYTEALLLSGGSASGKTEFMSEYLTDKDRIVFDGTLPSFEGAKIKIRAAQKRGKQVKVIAVWPADIRIAFSAFLQRDRKFPDEHFYRTHSQSRKTLLEIVESNLGVPVELYENQFSEGGLTFYHYDFVSHGAMVEFIRDNQYTEEEIIELITS